MRYTGTFLALLISTTLPGFAQDRNLPEEVRALAAVCAAGTTDVELRGELEGGLNKLFGQMLVADGELNVRQSGTDFINSFEDERLKLEARKIVTDCVVKAMEIIYDFKRDDVFEKPSGKTLLVPAPLQRIAPDQTFALLDQGSVTLWDGAIFAISRTRFEGKVPVATISNKGAEKSVQFTMGERAVIPNNESCSVALYATEPTADGGYKFSFTYTCQ